MEVSPASGGGGENGTTDGEKAYLVTKEKLKNSSGFGGKTIGFVGGFSLLVSNLTGPGLVTLSIVYQDSGYLTPTISLILMMVMSTLAAVFLCEAMATLPGNESLQGRVEFTTLVRFFFGRKGHIIAQVFINVALQATNVAGIVLSAQVMDKMFVAFFNKTCGVEIPHFRWNCVSVDSDMDSPFGDAYMLFTLGYLVVMCVIIPLGYLNLDDNIVIQVIALLFLFGVMVDWVVVFVLSGLPANVELATKNQVDVLGTVMFNFAYITTVPSWVNEKKPSVSIHRSLWSAGFVATAAFFIVGYLGARAFPKMDPSSDLLSVIHNSNVGNAFNRELSRIMIYLFPLMVLATSIPVYSIIVRYNLLQNKVCSKLWANLFAVVLPWVAAIPFVSGGSLGGLINWSSLAFGSVANFIIPFILYIKACNFRLKEREHLTEEQHEILKSMHEAQEAPPEPAVHSFRHLVPSAHVTPASSYSRLPTQDAISSHKSMSSHTANLPTSHSSLPHIIVTSASSSTVHVNASSVSTSRLLIPHSISINASTSSYSTGSPILTTSSIHEQSNPILESEDIPTPLPPEFTALPYTTPESARVVAWCSILLMTGLVVGVIVLAVLPSS